MKNNTITFKVFGAIVILLVLMLIFIHFTNDHKECTTIQETVLLENGTKTKTTKHICKEKYNL